MTTLEKMRNAKTSQERLELSTKLAKENNVDNSKIMKSSDDMRAWLAGGKKHE